jgi:N,N-dimethylformamidase beta subunit-like protein/flagellar hook capping protein FlgD
MRSALVRAVFGVLVLATVAAFFITQQLKSEFPLVLRFAATPIAFSPNGDGVRDHTRVGFDLSEPATVDFSILDAEGNPVRTLVDDKRLAGDTKHRFRWDGRDDDGEIVPDGTYRMRLVRRDEGRVIDSYKELRVDTVRPRVRLVSAQPSVIAPGEPGQDFSVRVRYAGPVNQAPEFRVFRTDDGPPRVVQRFRGDETRSGVWDGLVAGEPAPDGEYAFTVTVRDHAGNLSVAPTEIPTPRRAAPHTGSAARRFTLTGPSDVVTAGSVARMRVGPFDRSLDFVLSRLGNPKPIRRGERIGGAFSIHVPADAVTGMYLVRVRAGRHRGVWPLAVAGLPETKRAAQRPRPLLVLPTITWQGRSPWDDDGDGFAETLEDSRAVRLGHPYARAGFPPGFVAQTAPLLDFLERARLRYDLTTDVSLARGEGPALGNAPGVAFAGDARWLPPGLLRRLREYVRDGGKVASFGGDSFRRSVALDGDVLRNPSRPRRTDAFGERTEPTRTDVGAPMQVYQDELGIFSGLDAFVGDFTVFEQSFGLADGATPREAAGRDPTHPAFVAYDLGDGLVVRAGTPQWARELREARLSIEIPRATRRIWDLLSESR